MKDFIYIILIAILLLIAVVIYNSTFLSKVQENQTEEVESQKLKEKGKAIINIGDKTFEIQMSYYLHHANHITSIYDIDGNRYIVEDRNVVIIEYK